jgi:PAS domain S-box-containing protein
MPFPDIPLDAIREAALVYNAEGVVSAANTHAGRLAGLSAAGLSAEELADKVAFRLFDGRPRETFAETVRDALAGGDPPSLWGELAAADGSTVAVRIVTSPIREGGTVTGALSVWHDVSRKERPYGELSESEAKYRNLVELSPDAILIHQEGAIVFANPAAAALVGVEDPGELVGRPVIGLVHPDVRDDVEWNISADLRGEESPLTTVEIVRDDGTTVTVQGRGACIPLGGRPAVQVVLRDVTAQIRTQEMLRRSLERLGFAQRAAHSGFWEWVDPPNGLLSWSPELYDLFGLDPSVEPTMAAWLGLIHPDDREGAMSRVVASIANRMWLANEYRVVLPDGSERWIGAYGDTDYGADGRPLRTADVCYDITARKRAEAALRESEAANRTIFETANEGIWEMDARFATLRVNPRMAAMLGYTVEEMVGRAVPEFLFAEDLEEHAVRQEQRAGSLRGRYECRLKHRDGSARWTLVSATPKLDGTGAHAGSFAMFVDITERKQAEEALRESEERLRLAKECARIGIVEYHPGASGIASPDDFLMVDDDRFSDIRVHSDWRKTIHPDDLERVEAELEAAIALGEPFEVEFRYDLGGGRAGWLRMLGDGVFDESGRLLRMLGVQIDVTCQKEAEAALRESERRHAFLLALGDRLRELGGVPEITATASEMLCRHLGVNGIVYCEVDAAGESATVRAGWTDGTVPGEGGTFRLDEVGGDLYRQGGVRREADIPAGRDTTRATGRNRPHVGAALGVPVCRGGRLAALLEVYSARPRAWTDPEVELVREVSDRIWDAVGRARAETALRKRERTLQGIFRAAPVGIGMLSHRIITQANDQLCRMTGYAPDELLGRDSRMLYPDDETYVYVGREEHAQIRADGIGAVETRWRTRDGAVLDILLSSSPVDLSRPHEDVVFNALDITRLRESERALESYMDDLQRSNEELQRFAYVASHDLQEPLRSIVSFSQLLERRYKGKLDEDADDYIGFIVEGGNRMQRLIEDLLQLSRVETKGRPLAPTDTGEVVADALRLMDASIREAGSTVAVGEMPTVMADAAQLAQVFQNLLGNALKYRRPDVPPEIRITAERAGAFWRFAVQDNGIGIEAEYFDRIFVIFQRLHTREEYEGTGIGLAVVRKIVERHGGRVGVESIPGEGSTFSFTLPAA